MLVLSSYFYLLCVCLCVCVCVVTNYFVSLQFTGLNLVYLFLLSAFLGRSTFVTPLAYCRDLMCALFVFCAPVFRCLFLWH